MTLQAKYDMAESEHIWKEEVTEEVLQFVRQHAWKMLLRWNSASACPLSREDLEDILGEVLIATLHFKVPEDAEDWKPCVVGFVKRVAYRIYCRFQSRRPRDISLESLPPDCLIAVSPDDESEHICVKTVVHSLLSMPRHHALAFLLHLDCDLLEALLEVGGQTLASHLGLDTLAPMLAQVPLRDREIAQMLQLPPRAVIRARQHARQRLRTCLQESSTPHNTQ